jgi:hypothetical protein|tara:strand:+ start:92 stop:415 length:324 start_codon:yes stop_codon:yes gene_type:complete
MDLAYEFDFSDKKEVEKKIKRHLKYYRLGKYSQERVEYIRVLKNDLHTEITLGTKSKYFQKSKSNHADLKDYKFEKMKLDYIKKYDSISENDMSGILSFAIYLYHIR